MYRVIYSSPHAPSETCWRAFRTLRGARSKALEYLALRGPGVATIFRPRGTVAERLVYLEARWQ